VRIELDASDAFAEHSVQVVRNALPPGLIAVAAEYCRLKGKIFKPLFTDPLCPNDFSVYSDLLAESIMVAVQPTVEKVCQQPLIPTFSYLRIYSRGSSFERHFDRKACEVSGSLTIEAPSGEPWPLNFALPKQDLAVHLAAGDMVVYRGSKIPHWREPLQGDYQAQIIVNFVVRGGPDEEYAFDKRRGLGYPTAPRSLASSGRGGESEHRCKTQEFS